MSTLVLSPYFLFWFFPCRGSTSRRRFAVRGSKVICVMAFLVVLHMCPILSFQPCSWWTNRWDTKNVYYIHYTSTFHGLHLAALSFILGDRSGFRNKDYINIHYTALARLRATTLPSSHNSMKQHQLQRGFLQLLQDLLLSCLSGHYLTFSSLSICNTDCWSLGQFNMRQAFKVFCLLTTCG